MHVKDLFNSVASKAARAAGSLGAFVAALAVILIWVVSGLVFGFNDTWQLVINTGTTIIMFLMVFLIQHTLNGRLNSAQLARLVGDLIEKSTAMQPAHAELTQVAALELAERAALARERAAAKRAEAAEAEREAKRLQDEEDQMQRDLGATAADKQARAQTDAAVGGRSLRLYVYGRSEVRFGSHDALRQ